jgi:hypothetical protein
MRDTPERHGKGRTAAQDFTRRTRIGDSREMAVEDTFLRIVVNSRSLYILGEWGYKTGVAGWVNE